jgi:hypothetical protein
MFWGRKWFERVCASTRHMIKGLESLVWPTRELIYEGVLDKGALDYPPINNGCEIIP